MVKKFGTLTALGLVAALVVVAALAGCGGSTSGDSGSGGEKASDLSGNINIEGSDTMVNMAQAWAEDFMGKNPGVVISVKGGGSGNGIAALINGTADFADASREMKDEEKTQAKDKGVGPVETAVAKDGIAVVVNPSNTVADITVEQIGRIFRGEITNWKEVGGADKDITLISRDPSSGTYEFFKEAVVGKDKDYAKSAKMLPSNQAIVDEVKGNADAIGYVGVGYVSSDVKALKVNGVESSIDTVLDKTYPLSRDLYMYSNGQPTGVKKAYLDWILSSDGQKLVEDQGFVPLRKL